jgi:hypothetical protein
VPGSTTRLPQELTQLLLAQIRRLPPQCDVSVQATHASTPLQTWLEGQRESRVPAAIGEVTHWPALQRAVRHVGAVQCASEVQPAQLPDPLQNPVDERQAMPEATLLVVHVCVV